MIIDSIEDYRKEILQLRSDLGQETTILFRGQSDESWKIESSLERYGVSEIECKEYYRTIDRYKPLINPIIENHFERKFTISGYPFDFSRYDEGSFELPEMEYLAYLRHHAFPTPLVDFSMSCFIALFFACEDFNQPKIDKRVNGKVFLYASQVSVHGNNIPELRRIGRYVEAGKRHFAQQSNYLLPIEHIDEWKFIPFMRAMEDQHNKDKLLEINISKDVKVELMRELHDMNINRYTMYLNEDALIKSLADDWALERLTVRRLG
ncbi:FRG domain-containing protein [Methyloglobulus sp.]|jgi:FRG domain|uniref:FRG domain-containing protein n=1 Tax=Methyloglobulus sp. TaxID=2518622 RepID=UPI0032B7DC88